MQRKKGLKRGNLARKKTPARAAGKTTGRRDTGPDEKTTLAILERDGYACARCGRPLSGEWSRQHRLPRQMGGRKDANGLENLLALCGSGVTLCHGHVESNREESYREGFLVRNGMNPAEVPVSHARWGRVYLLPDGTVRAA